MKTKASFIDPKRVKVEIFTGETYILGFMSNYHYLLEEKTNHGFTNFLASLFDKYYDGSSDVIMNEINRQLKINNHEFIFYVINDSNEERERIGEKIKQLRENKQMDAKTLAEQAGIDAANLCRIEQGKYSVGLDVLSKIANALGTKVDLV